MLKKIVICLALLGLLLAVPSSACSSFMQTNSQGTFVGRTMEWWGPLKTRIAIFPRGLEMKDPFGPISWKMKYGAVVMEDEGACAEGVNEKGLTAHLLYQSDSQMPELKPGKPEISTINWIKYALGNYGSVKEVVSGLKDYQLKMVAIPYQGKKVKVPCHFSVNDETGDAAIIEFNGGKLQVFHSPKCNVMTNEPDYPAQLANLAKIQKAQKLYSIENLPGGALPANRFVRLSFNLAHLLDPKTPEEAVAYMEQVIATVLVPAYDDKKHKISPDSDAWNARWHVVYDLKRMNMFFDQDETGKKLYLKLKDIDFTGKEIKYLELKNCKSVYDL